MITGWMRNPVSGSETPAQHEGQETGFLEGITQGEDTAC